MLIDVIEVSLSIMIVDIGNRRVLLLMRACEIHFPIEGLIDDHIFEYVLIGGFELI